MESPGRRVVGPLPRETDGVEISQRVVELLSRRAPLTVLRGPRGFGKTATIRHWLATTEHRGTVIYLPLSTVERDSDEFWARLREQLAVADEQVDGDDDGDHRGVSLRQLHAWRGPLLLVLDNFHEAGLLDGAEGIDDDLIELVRVNADLELIAAGRSLRPLETTGALSVDSYVVRPRDLALDGPAVQRLAARRGREISHDEAAELATDLGGWPAAIRGCLDAADAQDAAGVDAMLVDGYITTMLEDIRSIELREFLLRTAVPDEFAASVLPVIAPGIHGLMHLRTLRMAELLQHRRTVTGSRFAYPRAIRESILRYVREHRAELVREVHLALLPSAAREEGPFAVLRHAIEAEEWSTALAVLEDEWVPLVSHHRRLLGELVNRFPPELVAGHTRLQVIAEGMRGVSGDGSSEGEVTAGWRAREPALLASILEARARETGVPGGEDRAAITFQVGAAALLAGDTGGASYAFGAVREAGLAADDLGARLMGAIGLLLSHAIPGDAEAAIFWADDPELADVMAAPQAGSTRLITVGARLGHALALVDMMSPAASDAVARILEPPRRDEVWAATVAVRAMHASVVGDDELRARRAREVRNAMRQIEPDAPTGVTLATALVQLQLQAGMPHAAEQVLERSPARGDIVATRALWSAHTGAWSEVLRLTDEAGESRDLSQRGLLLSNVVRIWALHSQGQHTAAGECFRRAAHIARESGQRRAFHLVPARVLRAVGGSVLEELCPGLGDAAGRREGAGPLGDEQPRLSTRELEVLAALHEHSGPSGISEVLGISVNTAKTHLRNVYRKLGASGRDEALRLSETLLLGRHG